jgi:SAM-dependent methyltransferase
MNFPMLRAIVETAILAPQYNSQEYVNDYLKVHMNRFTETVALLQTIIQPGMRVVDLGSYGSLVPALKDILDTANITLTEPFQDKKPSSEDSFLINARNGERYSFHVDRFDIEGAFPYPDASFDVAIFTEVLEHLSRDPSHTLSEINRITKVGGYLVLSTPNCASMRSVLRILRGGNPNIYPVYQRHPSTDRHNHEYVPWEVRELLKFSGYTLSEFKTTDVYEDPQFGWIRKFQVKAILELGKFLTFNLIKARDRGDTIFAIGRKTSGIQERYPGFLYAPGDKTAG